VGAKNCSTFGGNDVTAKIILFLLVIFAQTTKNITGLF
jgi:hypothetical protein